MQGRLMRTYMQSCMYGADPEGFFTKESEILASEAVLPEVGLGNPMRPIVVRDGVQFELNPMPAYSPRVLADNIANAFTALNVVMQDKHVGAHWGAVVDVPRETLDTLSEKSRILGCLPSKNVYGDFPVTVDGKTYTKRSAGGHLHFGFVGTSLWSPGQGVDRRRSIIRSMDYIVGNMMVLLDRDPGQKTRRENYGRAGEYRDTDWGVEYRTLSNFWLRNYALFSIVFNMADLTLAAVSHYGDAGDYLEDELETFVPSIKIREAIDQNDFNLALENFEALRPWHMQRMPNGGATCQLPLKDFDAFIKFAKGVKEYGILTYFPNDPIAHWCSRNFEDFYSFMRRIEKWL